MNIITSGKDFSLTPALKAYVESKMARIGRIIPSARFAKVELDVDHNQRSGEIYRAEISVTLGGATLKAGQKSRTMQSAILRSIEKLARQIETFKGKHTPGHRRVSPSS